jgi:hypothetical protein
MLGVFCKFSFYAKPFDLGSIKNLIPVFFDGEERKGCEFIMKALFSQ